MSLGYDFNKYEIKKSIDWQNDCNYSIIIFDKESHSSDYDGERNTYTSKNYSVYAFNDESVWVEAIEYIMNENNNSIYSSSKKDFVALKDGIPVQVKTQYVIS